MADKKRARDTRTGSVLEQMIVPALLAGGYSVTPQHNVGERFGGGKHFVDLVAQLSDDRRILISLKWQQSSGTAEQKVPFEIMCLADAILKSEGNYSNAYLVLGGEGWKLREFFTKGGLAEHLTHSKLVTIITLEGFVAKANRGSL